MTKETIPVVREIIPVRMGAGFSVPTLVIIAKNIMLSNVMSVPDDLAQTLWVGMPEFIQEKQEPFAKIIVRVNSEADLEELSELLGQKLTAKTKSVWFPFRSHWGAGKKFWVCDES